MAKGIKTGGRVVGSKNKAAAAKAAEIAKSGLTPLDYMLKVMRDEAAPVARRDDMAKAAAPYVNPKLAQVEHSGKGGKDLIPPTDPIDIARRVAFLLASAVNK